MTPKWFFAAKTCCFSILTKMDANLIGVPQEPFGLCKDVRPQLLPIPKAPSWKSVAFIVRRGKNRIRINVRSGA